MGFPDNLIVKERFIAQGREQPMRIRSSYPIIFPTMEKLIIKILKHLRGTAGLSAPTMEFFSVFLFNLICTYNKYIPIYPTIFDF